MTCCHHYELVQGCESAFSADLSAITFGAGCLEEAGEHAAALGLQRVALFTDPGVRQTPHFSTLHNALRKAIATVEVFDESHVEPTDKSFQAATRFASEFQPDGYVSIGGGSAIDTCKAANLYATWPAEFDTYVNAPVGDGRPVPGPLKPHIACPTTCGTGSECTGIAIFDYLSLKAKTGIASRELRPTLALIDPLCTGTLPATVVACSAFDVLSHALESYTAKPYTRRPKSSPVTTRPMSQGANPWSDLGCREAMRLLGKYMVRAISDAGDTEARHQVMWAATLAGIAFGNAGVHLPHGMSYSVAGLVRDFRPRDYPQHEAMVPHGMSVILNAPSVFRTTAAISPDRHLEAAALLGAQTSGAESADAGEVLANQIISLMKASAMPNGLAEIGYSSADASALMEGAIVQQRLLTNAPMDVDESLLTNLYQGAMQYW